MPEQEKCECQSSAHGHRPGQCPHQAVSEGLCKECNEETRVAEANPYGTRNTASSNQWTCMQFTHGKQSGQGWFYRKGAGDPTKVERVQFAGTIKENSPAETQAAVLLDGFRIVEKTK